jgi:phosphomannomutase
VVFANDAINSALIPILKNQGHTIKKEKSQPLSEACQTLKKINSEKTNKTPLAIGVVIDEAGEAIHLIDEKGEIIPPSALAVLVYKDFFLKNKETLKEQKISVTLALDTKRMQIGQASAIESLASWLNQDKTALNDAGIQAVYIASDFLSTYRRHITQEIEKLLKLKQKIRKTNPNSLALCSKITDIINSLVVAESSGHYFSVTDEKCLHDSFATDDGIFWAARLLEILDARKEPFSSLKMSKKQELANKNELKTNPLLIQSSLPETSI